MPSIILGKDVSIAGVSGARSLTVNNTAVEADCTRFGDTSRKFRKVMIEQSIEVECVDSPGVSVGATFALTGSQTGNVTYVVTNVTESQPLDDIVTFTVSASRTNQ